MATPTRHTLTNPVEFDLNGTLAGYWAAVLRVVTGYWSLHAGVTKFAFAAGRVLGLDALLERTDVGNTRAAKFLRG